MKTVLIVIGVLGIVAGMIMQFVAVGFFSWLVDRIDAGDNKSRLNTAGKIIGVLGLLLAWSAYKWG